MENAMIDLLSNHIDAGKQRITKLKRLSGIDQRLLVLAIKELTDSLEEALTIQEHVRAERDRTAHEQDKIRDEREHYFQFFERAPYAYVITSLTGLIAEANEACRSLFNFEKSFLVGLPLRVFVSREERTTFDEFVRASIGNRTARTYSFHVVPHNKPAVAATLTVCLSGNDPQLAWTIAATGVTETDRPPQLVEERQCFEDWKLGKNVRWVGESSGGPQTQALEWVTEWERGIQQKWQPYIPGLE
jgi:PAS domain S-box-containing protein